VPAPAVWSAACASTDPAESLRPHLRLADLVADPQATLKARAQALLLECSRPLESALTLLAQQLTGTTEDLGSASPGARKWCRAERRAAATACAASGWTRCAT
jgi:hypothetical protein